MTQRKMMLAWLAGFCLVNSLFSAVEVKLGKKDKTTMPTRAVKEATLPGAGPTYVKSVFSGGTGYFGDTAGGQGTKALVKAELSGNAKAGYEINPVELATDVALNNKKISLLTLDAGNPAVVAENNNHQVTVVNKENGTLIKQSGVAGGASKIHDAGDDAIAADPPAITAGIVDGKPLVFAAVKDKRTNKTVSPAWLSTNADAAVTAAVGALETQLSGVAAPAINKPIAKQVAMVLKGNTDFKGKIRDLVGGVAAGANVTAANLVAINSTVDGAFGAAQVASTAEKAAVIGTTPSAALAVVDEKARVANAAKEGDNTTAVGAIANIVLTGAAAAGLAVDRFAAGDDVKTCAAAAVEGGTAWAVRTAAATSDAAATQGFFKDGVDGVAAGLAAVADKPLAKFAATVVPIDTGDAIKTAGAAAITKAAWAGVGAENKGVNKRILAAADYAADPAKGEVQAAVAATVTKLAGDNAKTFFVSPADFALRAAELAAAAKAPGTTGPLPADIRIDIKIAIAPATGAANNLIWGSNRALESAFARAVGSFQLQNDSAAALKAATDSTVGAIKDKMIEVIGPRATANTVEEQLHATPIAEFAARAVRENLSLRSEDLGQAYAVVADAVQPNDWAAVDTNRLKQAWGKVVTAAQDKTAVASLAAKASAVHAAAVVDDIAGVFTYDNLKEINSVIWNVAKSKTMTEAVDAAIKIITSAGAAARDKEGAAAAIAAGLGWGIRCADVEAANDAAFAGGNKGQRLSEAVRDVLITLEARTPADAGAVTSKAAVTALKNAAPNNFVEPITTAVQNAIKDAGAGAVKAANGVIDRVGTKGKALAVELAKARQDAATPQTLPYIDSVIAGRIATVAAVGDADATRAALVAPLVAGLENTYPAGVTAALTAGLANAARNYKFTGKLFNDPVANAVNPWASLAAAQAASTPGDVQGFATAAITKLEEKALDGDAKTAITSVKNNATASIAWNDLVQQAVTDARLIKAAIEADTAAKSTDATSVTNMIGAIPAIGAASTDVIAALNKVATIKQAAANAYAFIPTIAQIPALVPVDATDLAKATSAAHIGFDAITSMAADTQAAGIAAALIATLGYGVRMVQLGDVAANDWNEEKITQQIVTPMIKTMAQAAEKNGAFAGAGAPANANAVAALTALWDAGKESADAAANPTALAARHKIAQTILSAVKSGTDFAAQRAAFFANNGIFVNNIVANEFDHFGVSAKSLTDMMNKNKAKIANVAKADTAVNAATASQAVAIADQAAVAPNLLNSGITTAGAAAVLHAAGGYGASQVAMATDPAAVVATVLTGGGNKVLDELAGAAPGGYGADKTIAKEVAVELLADVGGTLPAAKTAIVAAVKSGTGTAAGHVIGRFKDNPVAEAAWAVNDPAVKPETIAPLVGLKDNGLGVIRLADAASAAGLVVATAVDHILQPNGIGGVDRDDSKADGAAAAIEAGAAWALRNAPANNAFDVAGKFTEGATPVNVGLVTKATAQGAAQLVIADVQTLGNPAGSIKAAAEKMIKYDATKWNDTNLPAVNDRIYQAAASIAADVTKVDAAAARAGDAAGPLAATFNVVRGDVRLNAGNRMRDAATQLTADTIAAKIPAATDTVTNGAIIALEGGLAVSGARLPVSDTVQGGAGANGLLKFFNDATYNLNGDFGLKAAGKPIASTAAKAFIHDLNNDPAMLDMLYNIIKPLVVPEDWLVDTDKNRVEIAWVDVCAEVVKSDAGSIAFLANAARNAGGALNITANFKEAGKNIIWNVAKQETVQAAANEAAKIIAINRPSDGAAAAIMAGLGWGIRNAVIGTANVDAVVKEAMTALKTNAGVVANNNALACIGVLEADTPSANAFRVKVSQVVQDAMQKGAQRAAEGTAGVIASASACAPSLIEQLNPVAGAGAGVDQAAVLHLPYLDADRMKNSINHLTAAEVAAAIAPAAVTADNYGQGISAGLEAALTWAARNFVLQGQLVNPAGYVDVDPLDAAHAPATAPATTDGPGHPCEDLTKAGVNDIKAAMLDSVPKAKAGALKLYDQLDQNAPRLKSNMFDVLDQAAKYARTQKAVSDSVDRIRAGYMDTELDSFGQLAAIALGAGAAQSKLKNILQSFPDRLFVSDSDLNILANNVVQHVGNEASFGIWASIVTALNAGIRNVPYDVAHAKPEWTVADIDQKMVIPMLKAASVKDAALATPHAAVQTTLDTLWDNAGGAAAGGPHAANPTATSLRNKIAQLIYDAVASVPAIATEKARVLVNNAILVNNLVANPHFGVTPKLITDAIKATNQDVSLPSERSIVMMAKKDTAREVAVDASNLARADVDYAKAGSITAAAASAAIQAAAAWGTHAAVVDSTAAQTKDLITAAGGDTGVFDALASYVDLFGIVHPGVYNLYTHAIANNVAAQLAADNGAGGFLEKFAGTDGPRVLGSIGTAVTAGTKAAAEDLVGRLKVVSPAAQAVWLLKAPADTLTAELATGYVGNLGNANNCARVAAGDGLAGADKAAQAITAAGSNLDGAGGDTVYNGALAAVEAGTGWLIHEVNAAVGVAKDPTTVVLGYDSRPWKTTEVNDGGNRGIAVLNKNLEPVGQGGGTQAKLLSVAAKDEGAADIGVAFKLAAAPTPIDSACLGGGEPVMYWDETLKRMFVGLQGVQRGKNNVVAPLGAGVVTAPDKQGGVVGVLVGEVAVDQLSFKPILDAPTNAKLTHANLGKAIVGFYADENAGLPGAPDYARDTLQTSIYNLRTMHTSTGKHYLIVNGGTGVDAGKAALARAAVPGTEIYDVNKYQSKLYALPITAGGQLAKKNDLTALADAEGNLTKAGDAAAIIGVLPSLIGGADTDVKPEDIQVFGDSVYVAMAGTRAVGVDAQKERVEAGIFSSTALFDKDGLIVSWTPWKRVGGTTDKVYGFGMEPKAATPLYLTETGGTIDTIKSSAWGQSSATAAHPVSNRLLSDVLKTIFGSSGGVYQLYSFDENTPGFEKGKFSMMVAVGYDRVALIQTGVWNAGTNTLDQPVNFVVGTNVFVFTADQYQALKDIMPLKCAEVLRDGATADYGYLYIGGYRGLARFELDATHNGWNSVAGLGALSADGLTHNEFPKGTNWRIVKLPDWNGTCVTSLAGGVNNVTAPAVNKQCLQVVGPKKMAKTDAAGAPLKSLALSRGQFGCDVVVIPNPAPTAVTKDKVIVALTDGLYVASDTLDDAVKVDLLGTNEYPVQMVYISSGLGTNSATGDLYVLANTRGDSINSKIYRFAVSFAGAINYAAKTQDVVQRIANTTPRTIPSARQFATDGSVFLTVRAKNPSTADSLVQIDVLGSGNAEMQTLVTKLGMDTGVEGAWLAKPVKDSFGSWVLASDVNTYVNE